MIRQKRKFFNNNNISGGKVNQKNLMKKWSSFAMESRTLNILFYLLFDFHLKFSLYLKSSTSENKSEKSLIHGNFQRHK